jgi:hypothetical protein
MAAKVTETAEELRGAAHAIPDGGLATTWGVVADEEQSESQPRTGRPVLVAAKKQVMNGVVAGRRVGKLSYPHLSTLRT